MLWIIKDMFSTTYAYTLITFVTFPKSRQTRRNTPELCVSRSQLPVAVESPALDAATNKQGTCVVHPRSEG